MVSEYLSKYDEYFRTNYGKCPKISNTLVLTLFCLNFTFYAVVS